MKLRIAKARALFDQYNIDALLVINDTDIKYLCNYPASESWLLITPKKSYYLTDFRYFLEVKKGLKGAQPVLYKGSIFKSLFDLLEQEKIRRVGFNENHWNLLRFKQLQKDSPKKVKWVEANTLVESLREIKDSDEIDLIKKGLRIHQKALIYIKKYIKPGNSEQDVFNKLDAFVRAEKVGFSFRPIIASGPNSSYPHASVTTRKIKNNEPVLLDMGIDINGYKTDLTRMFFLGRIPNLVREIEAHVHEAQQIAIASISDGVSIAEVDLKARKYLESKKLAKYFGHSLGHGVGLDIHESPRLYYTNSKPLKAGMIVTVEPAVYLPNQFGIRLEEMILVKKKGCVILSGNVN
ncbi:MAG: aminopeptidase P family protein [Candidatus Omnitrophica bacterium]|nr:aminopeptidase P family protein [Candidatus Omnitrophota bacterium]